jgi:hypothetical protein
VATLHSALALGVAALFRCCVVSCGAPLAFVREALAVRFVIVVRLTLAIRDRLAMADYNRCGPFAGCELARP